MSVAELAAGLAVASIRVQEVPAPGSSAAGALAPTFAPAPGPVSEDEVLIGRAISEAVEARRDPAEDASVVATFDEVNPQGAPQVFLLVSHERGELPGPEDDWYEALLPVRPNGTTAYIRAEDLHVSVSSYRLVVERSAHTLTLWDGPRPVETFDVGIGKGSTPTPVGLFYLVSLLEPPAEGTIYGDYAYGLSAYSEEITDADWNGQAIIGLHGTNDPSSVGRAVSHGCIRMRNQDIAKLVEMLPLGTPILIV